MRFKDHSESMTKNTLAMLIFGILVLLQTVLSQSTNTSTTASQGYTTFDGVTQDRQISYYSVTGDNGIKAELDNHTISSRMDYFMRLWIRPDEKVVTGINRTLQTYVFLDISKSFRCFIQSSTLIKNLVCQQYSSSAASSNTSQISIDISDVSTNVWLHVGVGGSASLNSTYIRIGYQDKLYKMVNREYYVIMQQTSAPWYAYVGISQDLGNGFIGDLREFFFTQTYVNYTQMWYIKNQVIYMDLTQIANYRFQAGSLADMFRPTQTSELITTGNQLPKWQYDYLAADVCPAFFNFTTLPYIDYERNSFAQAKIDSRFVPVSNFQYSVSFWMKTMPGLRTTSSAQVARDSIHFFVLNEAFTLWFSEQTSIRIFFHATRSFYETSSKAIFFPQGIWANLQIQIDRTNGYDMRVYDIFRRLVTRQSDTVFLQDQSPTGQFTLAKNFKGYIKQAMVWAAKLSLPIAASNGQRNTIQDNTLIIYYKLDQTNFKNNSFFPSLGFNGGGLYGPNVFLQGSYSFDLVEWDDSITFSNPSQVGTVTQNFTLYDGVACSEKLIYYKTNSNTSSISSDLRNFTQDLTEATVELWFRRLTPLTSINILFSLFSLTTGLEYLTIYQAPSPSLALLCKPFDNNQSTSQLQYLDYAYGNNYWHHVSCRFQQGQEVGATLYTDDLNNEYFYSSSLVNSKVIVPAGQYKLVIGNRFNQSQGSSQTFYKDVKFWSESRTLLEISKFRFQQIDPIIESNLLSYFKLNEGLVSIVDFVGLVNNMPLSQITAKRVDINNEAEPSPNNVICPQYSFALKNQSCYRNPFYQHQLVILSMPNEVFQGGFNTLNTSWLISSNFSDMISPFSQFSPDNFIYTWSSVNSSALLTNANINISSQSKSDLIVQINSLNTQSNTNQGQSSGLGSQQSQSSSSTSVSSGQYNLMQTVQNSVKTFQTNSNLTFNVKSCRQLYDSTTRQPIRKVIQTNAQNVADLFLTFEVKDVCNSDTLNQTVKWQVFPSYLNITDFTTTYDETTNKFTLTIPYPEQVKFPTGENVFFLGTVQWTGLPSSSSSQSSSNQQTNNNGGTSVNNNQATNNNSSSRTNTTSTNTSTSGNQTNSSSGNNSNNNSQTSPPRQLQSSNSPSNSNLNVFGSSSNNSSNSSNSTSKNITYSLNIVYQIKYVEQLRPIIGLPSQTGSQVLIGENLVMDASGSYSFNITDSVQRANGLMYQWTCPPEFETQCQKIKNDKYFNFTYDNFLASNGQYFTDYLFYLSVWKGNDPDQSSNFTTNVTIRWLKIARPDFIITTESNTQPIVQNDNIVKILFKNYDTFNTALNIKWTISPSISDSNLIYSANNTALKILKGALSSGTFYNFTVAITHKTFAIATKTVSYVFTTRSGPNGGGVAVSPSSGGTALSTNFTFSISNWQSSYPPVSFTVTGTSTNNSQIPITDRSYLFNETFSSVLTRLTKVTFAVVDQSNEITYVSQDLLVSENTSPNVVDTISSSSLTQRQKLNTLLQATYQVQNLNTTLYSSTIQSVKVYTLDYLNIISKTYSASDNVTDESLNTMTQTMNILSTLTTGNVTDNIMSTTQTVLKQLQNSTQVFTQKMQDQAFAQNYAILLSNLMSYYYSSLTTSITTTKNSRLLQSSAQISQFQQILAFKDQFADYYCQSLNNSMLEIQKSITTDYYQLIVEKIPLNSRVFSRYFFNQPDMQYLTLPYDEIIKAENNYYGNLQNSSLNRSNSTNSTRNSTTNSTLTTPNSTCVQVTLYSKINPFKGLKFVNQSVVSPLVIQVNTINDLNVKVLERGGPITLNTTQSTQLFNYWYNDTSFQFRNNQTVVEYIDGVSNVSKKWTADGCLTRYSVSTNTSTGNCRVLGAYYYALITDLNRVYVKDLPDQVDDRTLFQLFLDFDAAVIPVLLFLIFIMIPLPIISICLDKKDYNFITLAKDDKDWQELLMKVAIKKHSHYQKVLYKLKLYLQYNGNEINFGNLFIIYFKNLHPLMNLFYKFDLEFKRLNRYIVFAFQYAIIAIICAIVFGKSYRASESDGTYSLVDRNNYDLTDVSNAILAGFIMSLLTLPFPNTWIKCCKAKLGPKKEDNQDGVEDDAQEGEGDEDDYEEGGSEQQQHDNEEKVKSQKKPKKKQKQSEDEYEGGDSESEYDGSGASAAGGPGGGSQDNDADEVPNTNQRLKKPNHQIQRQSAVSETQNEQQSQIDHESVDIDINEDLEPNDKCISLKLTLIILSVAITFAAIVLVAVISAQIPKANCRTIVIAFFTTILVGWLITNTVRILINAAYAQSVLREEQENEGGCCQNCLLADDAVKMVKDMYIMREIQFGEETNKNEEDRSQNYALQGQKGKEITIENQNTGANNGPTGRSAEENKSIISEEEDSQAMRKYKQQEYLQQQQHQKQQLKNAASQEALNKVKGGAALFGGVSEPPKDYVAKQNQRSKIESQVHENLRKRGQQQSEESEDSDTKVQPRNTYTRQNKMARYGDDSTQRKNNDYSDEPDDLEKV